MRMVCVCLLIFSAYFGEAVGNERLQMNPNMRSSSSTSSLRTIPDYSSINAESYGTFACDFQNSPEKSNEMAHLVINSIPGVTKEGEKLVSQWINSSFEKLTEDEQALMLGLVMSGKFEVTHVWLNLWKSVAAVFEPVCELAKVGVVVMPLLPCWKADDPEYSKKFTDTVGIITASFGIVSLMFGKISGYAQDKVKSWERVINCLMALKEQTGDEEV